MWCRARAGTNASRPIAQAMSSKVSLTARVNSRPSFRNRPSRHAFDIVGLWETTSRVGIALKAEYYLTSFVTSSLFRDFISMNEPPKNI